MQLIELSHYTITALLVVVPAMCVAYGQGCAAQATLEGINDQPKASPSLMGCMFLGVVLNETAALLAVIMGGALILAPVPSAGNAVIVECGLAIALGIPAALVGFFSLYPHCAAIQAIARQPFQAGRINYFLAFLLSMMQMPVILGLIIAFLMRFNIATEPTIEYALKMVAMGSVFGISTIGPLLGMKHFTQAACVVLGYSPDAYGPIFSFALVSQALIETPILFALFISLLMFFKVSINPWAAIAAAIAMSLSTLGPGIASGMIAGKACHAIGMRPERAPLFSYSSVLAQTLVDASVVYGVIIATALVLLS
jgi:F-type H+-transporting ATPase subunit c